MTTSKLVVLDSFADPIKARLVSQRLEEEGIRTYLNGEEAAATLGGLNPSMVTVKLEIAEEDVERARELLTTPPEPETGIQTAPDEPDPPEDLSATPAVAERALRAALAGSLLMPAIVGMLFYLYSLYLATKVASRDENEEGFTWKVYLALAINAAGLFLGALYIRALITWLF